MTMNHPVITPPGRPFAVQPSASYRRCAGGSHIMIALGILIIVLVSAGMIKYWMNRTERVRQALSSSLAAIESMTRSELQSAWNQRVTWAPTPDSTPALAVLPRLKHKKFDAIYVVFEDDQVISVMAITSFAGYYNGNIMNIHDYPEKMVPCQLDPEELRGLNQMISLLELKLKPLEPQSNAYTWTNHVLDIAQKLYQLQNGPD
jgi:hypothetical protein